MGLAYLRTAEGTSGFLLGGDSESPSRPPDHPAGWPSDPLTRAAPVVATFVYARVVNFAAVSESVQGQELAALVVEVRRVLSASLLKLGGEIIQRRPDSILAMFRNDPTITRPNHAKRGLHAAILTVAETTRLGGRPDAGQGGPALTLAVGVHLGEAEVTRNAQNSRAAHAGGEAVEIARMLEVVAADLNWGVAASGRVFRAADGRVAYGRIASAGIPDGSFIDAVEITGLVPRPGSATPPAAYGGLREALAANKAAYRQYQDLMPHAASAGSASAAQNAGLLIEGYRILRKIGEGGMASIFLAEPAEGDGQQVLKIMPLEALIAEDGLQRFIQEFALLAQLRHPNVARIYRQDFSAGHAYIAMEYFPGGDLRGRIAAGMDMSAAVSYLKQICSGLGAIHDAGIVHRDVKPANIMLRHDGTVALIDLGVAKQMSMQITDTGFGDIIGTPAYLSAEQAAGRPVDQRADLYSLGVLAHEMLTGQKPYRSESAQALLELHASAPVPLLDARHAAFQPVLDRLMAKEPEQRYASALALLDDLARRGL